MRVHIPRSTETDVLYASRRRCCLCVHLDGVDIERKGQLAHLNRNPADSRFDNLVWLCMKHHDEYDTRRSQTKGYTSSEVRRYRDHLYRQNKVSMKALRERATRAVELLPIEEASDSVAEKDEFLRRTEFLAVPWRHPPWLEANRPSLFAYISSNGMDGVCLIERVDLPDGRIVIACIQVAGNPGNSITNSVEYICDQVCRRFSIPSGRLVWLEHYDSFGEDEWNMVAFEIAPPEGPFAEPKWIAMTPALWRGLWLRPRRTLKINFGSYESKLTKLFPWPADNADT